MATQKHTKNLYINVFNSILNKLLREQQIKIKLQILNLFLRKYFLVKLVNIL